MTIRSHARARRAITTTAAAATVGLVAACGGGSSPGGNSGMPGMDHSSLSTPSSGSEHGTPGMGGDMSSGDGLSASVSGFRFAPAASSLPAGQAAALRFQIQGAGGKAVTTFEPDQTKLMHFYLIRSDLTGFQHIHPEMATDGTWTAAIQPLQPGAYRAYTSFIAKDSADTAVSLVLGERLTVPGTAETKPLPAASTTTQVDGYTLTLTAGHMMAGMGGDLTVKVFKDGLPVSDLQPYLDTYAHLTAFHDGDLAFAHLHPKGEMNGDHGGPDLSFEARLAKSGNWRLFLQFQTAGTVHTAVVTLPVG
jgi:hypothetical protein